MRIGHQWCSHLFNHCHSSVEEREQLKAKYYSNRQPGFIVLDTLANSRSFSLIFYISIAIS